MQLKQVSVIFIILSLLISSFPFSVKGEQKDEFVLVIDPGHGGKDYGAIDNNLREKDINLGVAKKLAEKVKKRIKKVKVVMTRDNNTFISLQERANIANNNKGNLFISIHTNSVDKSNPNRNTVAGASVYALGLHKDQSNLQVARRENSVIELEKNYEEKYSGFDPNKDESYIIFEMAQKKNLEQSLKFADYAQKHLVSDAGRQDRGVKQAGFWVLWASAMPAVLVELDFICNPNSAIFMGSETGQEKLADALCNAIEQYLNTSVRRSADVKESKNIKDTDKTKNMSTPVLTSVVAPSQKVIDNNTSSKKSSVATKRRRRSESAKNASATKDYETKDILLRREDERLAIVDIPEEQEIEIVEEESPKVENAEKQSLKSKKSRKESVRTYNNKKVVVRSDDTSALSKESDPVQKNMSGQKTHTSASGYHSKVEKLTTVYKIQVFVSADLLKQNNPCFCGLSPIKSFRENNVYKYTYGESVDRKEMESLLLKVKEKIPDAFIISSRK